MSAIRIYVEGDSGRLTANIRQAFDTFFAIPKNKARQKRLQWQVIPCGPRNQAYRFFCNAILDHPQAVNILLVDSEGLVDMFGATWQHLKKRDGWDNPGVSGAHCHLMVCMVEAWFVADRETLTRHFQKLLKTMPDYADVEQVPKAAIEELMAKVSAGPHHRAYEKIKDGAKLLNSIRPEIVQAKAPHCRRLFETLDKFIEAL